MKLPKRIFFTGVPGSKWSGIAQVMESVQGFNTTDRTPAREYNHNQFSGHKGAYFGTDMEFGQNSYEVDQAWADPNWGTKLVKSHEWANDLKGISLYNGKQDGDWIMLVYRPTLVSNAWWHTAGGFNITYPNYEYYENSNRMLYEIEKQNNNMLTFAYDEGLHWQHFDDDFMYDYFGTNNHDEIKPMPDVLVAMWKP